MDTHPPLGKSGLRIVKMQPAHVKTGQFGCQYTIRENHLLTQTPHPTPATGTGADSGQINWRWTSMLRSMLLRHLQH
jgi:hypothetical protein